MSGIGYKALCEVKLIKNIYGSKNLKCSIYTYRVVHFVYIHSFLCKFLCFKVFRMLYSLHEHYPAKTSLSIKILVH